MKSMKRTKGKVGGGGEARETGVEPRQDLLPRAPAEDAPCDPGPSSALSKPLPLFLPFAFLHLKFFAFKAEKVDVSDEHCPRRSQGCQSQDNHRQNSWLCPPPHFTAQLSVLGRGVGAEHERPARRSSRCLGPVLPEPAPRPKAGGRQPCARGLLRPPFLSCSWRKPPLQVFKTRTQFLLPCRKMGG